MSVNTFKDIKKNEYGRYSEQYCQQGIPRGNKNGRPHYMAGPDDDVDQIMNTLNSSCGGGNYDFTRQQQGFMPPDFFV